MWIVLMIAALILMLWFGRTFLRPDDSKAAKLMKTYAHLTKETLEALPDEELVTAVVSNLLAKAESEKKNPYIVIPKLSAERCAVYSIWLFDKQLASEAPEALRHSGQFGFSELAADGLDFLEQPALATMLRDYLQTADDKLIDAMRESINDTPLQPILVNLIRSDISVFCDE